MIYNAILCLNTSESLHPHVHTQIQGSDGIFKVLEHLKHKEVIKFYNFLHLTLKFGNDLHIKSKYNVAHS